YGEVANAMVATLKDISVMEIFIFGLLIAAVFIIGLYPQPFLNVFHSSVGELLRLSLVNKTAMIAP
ncbi:MAG: NADH-quinone oxidoreductase subunit M, partial [Legionellales bacterium]|nr:NADH-quinone oxidoreductase subunit M [Legionellales bacterium]